MIRPWSGDSNTIEAPSQETSSRRPGDEEPLVGAGDVDEHAAVGDDEHPGELRLGAAERFVLERQWSGVSGRTVSTCPERQQHQRGCKPPPHAFVGRTVSPPGSSTGAPLEQRPPQQARSGHTDRQLRALRHVLIPWTRLARDRSGLCRTFDQKNFDRSRRRPNRGDVRQAMVGTEPLERLSGDQPGLHDLLAVLDAELGNVYAFILRRCGDRALAEDLTSDVMLRGSGRRSGLGPS